MEEVENLPTTTLLPTAAPPPLRPHSGEYVPATSDTA